MIFTLMDIPWYSLSQDELQELVEEEHMIHMVSFAVYGASDDRIVERELRRRFPSGSFILWDPQFFSRYWFQSGYGFQSLIWKYNLTPVIDQYYDDL